MAEDPAEIFEPLSRTVQEIQALQAIYDGSTAAGDSWDGGGSRREDAAVGVDGGPSGQCHVAISVLDPHVLDRCQGWLDQQEGVNREDNIIGPRPSLPLPPARIDLEVRMQTLLSDRAYARTAVAHIGLPLGYPSTVAATVAILSLTGSTRSERDAAAQRIASLAQELVGTEALLEIIQQCRDVLLLRPEDDTIMPVTEGKPGEDCYEDDKNLEDKVPKLCRKWIWVHHITDTGRKKDIVSKANELQLGGYLKAGYPGIVVVEGPAPACDGFVRWIKGNKSRPGGGFGRNWGHHERGQAVLDARQLSSPRGGRDATESRNPGKFAPFEEVPSDDMGILGTICQKHGIEDEFKMYVLQHSK